MVTKWAHLSPTRLPPPPAHTAMLNPSYPHLPFHPCLQVGFRGQPWEEVLEMSLSLVIASVPIALPMVMKVTLAVGAKEMAKEVNTHGVGGGGGGGGTAPPPPHFPLLLP